MWPLSKIMHIQIALYDPLAVDEAAEQKKPQLEMNTKPDGMRLTFNLSAAILIIWHQKILCTVC